MQCNDKKNGQTAQGVQIGDADLVWSAGRPGEVGAMIHGGFLLLPAEWTVPVQPLDIRPYFTRGGGGLQGGAGVFKQILRKTKKHGNKLFPCLSGGRYRT